MDRSPVIDALIAALTAGTGRAVGDAAAPGDPAGVLDYPYLVVHAIPGGDARKGSFAWPHDSGDVLIQVDSVGLRRDQTVALADRARAVIVGQQATGAYSHAITPSAGTVIGRSIDGDGGLIPADGGLVVWSEDYLLTVVG